MEANLWGTMAIQAAARSVSVASWLGLLFRSVICTDRPTASNGSVPKSGRWDVVFDGSCLVIATQRTAFETVDIQRRRDQHYEYESETRDALHLGPPKD